MGEVELSTYSPGKEILERKDKDMERLGLNQTNKQTNKWQQKQDPRADGGK